MSQVMDLRTLSTFHLVATQGSFGRAARASGFSKATVARHVTELENSLGIRLFERSSRSLRLTEEGRILLGNTQGPLDELNATGDALRGRGAELRGRLRVSAPTLFATYTMGSISAQFLARHPHVRLEVVAEDRYVDLVQEGYDVAIRANPQRDDDLVGRCFVQHQLFVVAPTALGRPPVDPEGKPITVPAVMRMSNRDSKSWLVEDGDNHFILRPDPVLRVSSLIITRDAVLAGAGVALLPSFLVNEHITSGRLVQWGVATEYKTELWVLHASTRLASSKVRAFVQFLIECFPKNSIEDRVVT